MRSKAPDPFELPTNWISKGVGMISVGLNVRSSRFVLACIVSILASAGVQAAETMLNFEDLPESHILTGTTYAGLTWENGLPVNGNNTVWVVGGDYAHSGVRSVVNSGGTKQIAMAFPSLVAMSGAYFARQGNVPEKIASAVRVHGFLAGQEVSITAWMTPIGSVPTWLDMTALANVDRILVESAPASSGLGAFCMDDLTFTYIPEPASLAMLALAGAGLLGRRRRECSH